MSLPSIFDYLPEQAPVLMKTAMSPALTQTLTKTVGVGPKIGLKRGGEQFAARAFNAEAAGLKKAPVNLEAHGLSGIDPFAKAAAEEKKEEPIPFNKDVLKAAIKTTIPYVLGVPTGIALGKGIGMGIEALEKHRGAPLIPRDMVIKYGPMAFMALGGLLAAREAAHRTKEREIWRSAYKSSQNGTAGSATK